MNGISRKSWKVFIGLFVISLGSSQVSTGTPIDKTITGVSAPSNYFTLVPFQTPTGAGTSRQTIARIVINKPTTGLTFRIEPKSTDPTGQYTRNVATFVLDGAVESIQESGINVDVADAIYASTVTTGFSETDALGYEIVQVIVEYADSYTFPSSPEDWYLKVKETTDTHTYRGFIGSSEAEVKRSKLALDPGTLNFLEVQINLPDEQVPVKSFSIQNLGTDILNVTGGISFSPSSPFSFYQPAVINPLEPMESDEIKIKFRPSGDPSNPSTNPLKEFEETMSITSNDPDSPSELTLKGKGITLDVIMLLDLSGSMNWYPDSSATAPELQARLWLAKQAGLQICQAYKDLTGGKARLGLYGFPDPDIAAPSSTKPVPINAVELILGQVSGAMGTKAAGGLKAYGWTPMAEGIKISQADLETGSNYYRPGILLLSDGAHNVDSTAHPKTPDDWIPTLANKNIRVYTVGYGKPGSPDVDLDLLQRLADKTDGEMLAANSTDWSSLKKTFRGALRELLGLNENADPKSSIGANEQKTHTVCVDNTAYSIVFVLDWDENMDNAISFVLRNPNGEQITQTTSGVSFYNDKTYAMYVVKGDVVRAGAGAGEWTLVLSGSPDLNEPLDYCYSVLTQTYAEMVPKFSYEILHTGKDLLLEAQLKEVKAEALKLAKISIDYDIPAESFGTYISKSEIDPTWILGSVISEGSAARRAETSVKEKMRVPGTIMGEPATMTQKKAYALKHFAKNPFQNKRSKGTIQLYDDGTHGDKVAGDGVFSAQGPRLQYDGLYEFFVRVEKKCLNRQALVTKYVPVHLSADLLKSNIEWKPAEVTPYLDRDVAKVLSEESPAGFERKSIVVTPQDEFGNYLGPGKANRVKFIVRNAETIGSVVDNLDGSYIQVIQYKKGDVPTVAVTVGDISTSDIPMTTVKASKIRTLVWIILISLLLLVIVIRVLRKPKAA